MPLDSDIFNATADNFHDTMNCHNANVGFRVPEYQRTYDWNKENIKRLLEDCLNGFYYLSEANNEESYTFLGTIILVREKSEITFNGNSLSVVDGQQRLTTLVLLCCALIEEILAQRDDVNHLNEPSLGWIKKEIDYIIGKLYVCVIGQLIALNKIVGFPRIVRLPEDNRAIDPSDAEYKSDIASFLNNFYARYLHAITMSTPMEIDHNIEGQHLSQNYVYIKDQVKLGIYTGEASSDTEDQCELEHEHVHHEDFQKSGLRDLFDKLDTVSEEQAEKDRAISHVSNTIGSSGLIRMMLFSHYVLKSVILTRVETGNEDAAFDIFDSLNTTGMPLTAIETFKPRVINFEKSEGNVNFSRTESAREFERIEENLNDVYIDMEKRQTEAKELIVTYALYLEGQKLSLNLASQRTYLRRTFDKASTSDLKRDFIRSLADITEFRQTYWNRDSIQKLDSIHNIDVSKWLKLCCTFISEMKTSLAIPIMARYWKQMQQDGSEENFVEAVKALTAFLVLRRSITGGTSGIDSYFRKLMESLCIGLDSNNSFFSLDELKMKFREHLATSRVGVIDKESWVTQVCEVPLVGRSKPLCRFLLFASSNNARVDSEKPGLLTRENIIPSNEIEFLNYQQWQGDKYATVEHIAPESNSGGWDAKIYKRAQTRNFIGNIILLPQKENSSVGNASWTKKKLFYRVLVAKTETDRTSLFKQAEKEGFIFKKQTKDLLKNQERLNMLEPIAEVQKWTESTIQKRTKNILELAWDEIAPWLGY